MTPGSPRRARRAAAAARAGRRPAAPSRAPGAGARSCGRARPCARWPSGSSPCRFKSWIMTISPSLTTCTLSRSSSGRSGGRSRPPPAFGGMPPRAGAPALRTGEFSGSSAFSVQGGMMRDDEGVATLGVHRSAFRGHHARQVPATLAARRPDRRAQPYRARSADHRGPGQGARRRVSPMRAPLASGPQPLPPPSPRSAMAGSLDRGAPAPAPLPLRHARLPAPDLRRAFGPGRAAVPAPSPTAGRDAPLPGARRGRRARSPGRGASRHAEERRHGGSRAVRAMALPEVAAPRVVGIDDWAWRRGHAYGTLVTGLERRRPVALLSDRQAERRGGVARGLPERRGGRPRPCRRLRPVACAGARPRPGRSQAAGISCATSATR